MPVINRIIIATKALLVHNVIIINPSPEDLSSQRLTPWCLVGNGGMDPYSSPYISPNNSPHNPFPQSLLRTRQLRYGYSGFGYMTPSPFAVPQEGGNITQKPPETRGP